MTNTAKMSSRQSEATRDLKKRNKQVNITTMKRYIKPAIEVIELNVSGSILLVLSKTEEEMGGDSALSDEHRSDWENIWGNM